ncbi:AAA family ATPase [Paenibacillus sinopodophylli]|uniref:AAA family ATPase n=1 Tax=Paenibacillus sinopodophylli TaxID=1837342 RepID=UPI00110CF497|nr:AAA family ATPase [Paenibacillus sinopodophylli]
MRLYETGFEYLRDELAVLERGMRILLADFESKEMDGQTPMSMRGLMVSPADIERSLQESEWLEDEDVLASFRSYRVEQEQQMERNMNDSISEGVNLPFAYLSWRLRLGSWEKRCVLLCLAAELDTRYESWFGYLNDDVTLRVPTTELALRLLGDEEQDSYSLRSLLAGYSTLNRFVLRPDKAVAERSSLKQPLRMDARIISFLLETESLDARIASVCRLYDRTEPTPELAFDQEIQVSLRLAVELERNRQDASLSEERDGMVSLPFIQLCGPSGAGKKLHARQLAGALEQPLLLIKLDKLARDGDAMEEQLRHVVREALLLDAMLCLDEGESELATAEGWSLIQERIRSAFTSYAEVARLPVLLWLTRLERRHSQLPMPRHSALINQALAVPGADVRLRLWEQSSHAEAEQEQLKRLADKYAFTAGQIEGMSMQAARLAARSKREHPSLEDYASASRSQVQHKLSELAVKQKVVREWDSLILPDEPLELLKDACSRHKYTETVFNRWGFGQKLPYGRGLSMLFAGPPGTGKTMAAEVVAGELGLELYRIDLSRVVSKYIGETEKNLRELFAEAENSGAILFFDEGDSLFGKRTEVKDSNDRFANMEAAYLLQRIETFEGVSILATNLLQNMDEAFLRRMQVIVKFPFPDAVQREQIFRSLLPISAPLDEDLDLSFLAARVDASGGHIKNIVLSAAFMAAAEQAPIGMRHMVRATRQELHKMGKIVVKESFEPYN